MSADALREHVVLVDEDDREVGIAEKLAAHADGRLHRAFSVFVFDHAGRLMLQRRAATKYHSGGLWSNTCCGHPRPFEPVSEAAHRRLREEMGFDCPLQPLASFLYQTQLRNGLYEHELDHIFVGRYDFWPTPDPREAEDWCWMEIPDLMQGLRAFPERYTVWFPLALERLAERGLLRQAMPPEEPVVRPTAVVQAPSRASSSSPIRRTLPPHR